MRRLPILLLAVSLLGGGYAIAQTGARQPQLTVAQAEQEAAAAARRSLQLQAQAAAAIGEAERARAATEALTGEIERIEADISLAEARIRVARAAQAQSRARLAEREEPVVRLTAALQVMARRPPALALVQPGSIDDLVRIRSLLASTLPSIREASADLRADLAARDRLRARADQQAQALAASRAALAGKRTQLAKAEAAQRDRSQGLAGQALLESDRSIALGDEARLLAAQERSAGFRAEVARRLALLPSPAERPARQAEAPESLPDYRMPAFGQVMVGAGELADGGVHSRGITLQTMPDQIVVAPKGGKVAYAGGFRSYGEVVIIDHGGGLISTLTGLAALRVRQGERVRPGDAIGRSGDRMTVELWADGRPVPIAGLIAPVVR